MKSSNKKTTHTKEATHSGNARGAHSTHGTTNTHNHHNEPKVYVREKKRPAPTKFMEMEHLDKIGEVAVCYGFSPVKSPAIEKVDLDAAKGLSDHDYMDDETEQHAKMPLRVEEKIALIRKYQEEDWLQKPQPCMIYLKDPCRGSPSKKSGYYRYADLEILGASGPIAEATLIQAGRAILSEEGYEKTKVEVNSVGDRESMAKWSRELTNYYRKNINEMTPEVRQMFKRDPFELLTSHDEAAKKLNEHAPRSMDFLSEESRRHLEEVLEYLEALNIPYAMNNSLIGNRSYCTETIFVIVNDDAEAVKKADQKILAFGVRYNGLAKRLGMKKDIQGVGLSLVIKGNKSALREVIKKVKRPIASFVQLGIESKLLSLMIVEQLRKAGIPLHLSLAKDRLGAQVSAIEKHHTPYVIVMGKKEAMEKSAIVRKVDTYSQEVVPIHGLSEHMKKIEKEYWKK